MQGDLRVELGAALRGLEQQTIASIAESVTVTAADRGATLLEQGRPSESLLLLLSGAARVRRTLPESGSGVVLGFVQGPALLGDPASILGQPASATCTIVRPARIGAIARVEAARLARAHPTLLWVLIAAAVAATLERDAALDSTLGGQVEDRILRAMDRLAKQHGTTHGRGRMIPLPIRRKDLGEMVGSTTETVSRIMAKHVREGRHFAKSDGFYWGPPHRAAPASTPPPLLEEDAPKSEVG